MGQFHYASIEDILKDNGVKTFKETGDGLVAIHKRNDDGGYYWKYYRYYGPTPNPKIAPCPRYHYSPNPPGYYYTGSTSKWEG